MDIKANPHVDLPRLTRAVIADLDGRQFGNACSARVTITRTLEDGSEEIRELAPEAMALEFVRDYTDISEPGDEYPTYKPGPLGVYLVAACRPGALANPATRTVTPAPARASA